MARRTLTANRNFAYPASPVAPVPPVDLSDRATRERLSGPGLRAFFNVITRWQVRDDDARLLLGGVTNGPYYEMKRQPDRLLDVDRLTRVSLIIGIFKALGVLYSDALADRWVNLPNTNRLFSGATPLAYMIRGGLPALQTVRRLLDARRAG
ncbi:MAG: antitoxin Xre/MbcA/ParS toxin-binding domain-containing protein [Vicinamibacteraceae bacterium]